MDDTTYYHNENLRSISAIVAARNRQLHDKKVSLFEESSGPLKISKQPINVIKIHQCSVPAVNSNSKKTSLKQNKLAINKTKKLLWRSSKVVPHNNNVFCFDDRSDLTLSDIVSDLPSPTKKDRRNSIKIKSRRRSKCIAIIICLFVTLMIIIISIVVSVALVTSSQT